MMTLNIQKQAALRFDASRLEREVERRLREAGELLSRAAKENASRTFRARSGRLLRSIGATAEGRGFGTSVRVEARAPYAAIQEFGGTTPAREILPRRASVLAFQKGGKIIFARRVNHPGARIPARPFMRPALEASRERIRALFARAFHDAFTQGEPA